MRSRKALVGSLAGIGDGSHFGYSVAGLGDLDGDGVVSDEELKREERMIRIENQDARDDQQRRMVWVSLISVCLAVVIILTPAVSESRLNIIIPFLDDLSIEAKDIGAVNTIKIINGKRIG